MKNFKMNMAALMGMAMLMNDGAEGGAGGAGGEAQKPAETPKVLADIIRGRMPVAVVAQVRFGDNKNAATKDLANMFGTTVGKIDDIKKNRNFAYVTQAFRPTQEQKDEGIAWLQKHPKFSDGSVDKLINELEAMPVATAEEAAAFAGARTTARGQAVTTKDGETANAGGGNRRGKKEKTAPAADAPQTAPGEGASAEELLS